MRTARIVAGILLALTSIHAFPLQQPVLTIQGNVSSSGTDQPISGAKVILAKVLNKEDFPVAIAPVLSDSGGNFVFKNLDSGSYRLVVTKNGYTREDTSVTLTSSETTRDLSIRLSATGTVSGHVRDASGRPAVDVPITLLRRSYRQDGPHPQQVFSTHSNDLGEYRIYGIASGRYYVSAGTTDSYPRHLEPSIFDQQVLRGENGVHVDYAQIYYPGVRDLGKAQTLDIQPGSDRSDLDFTMTRQRIFSARGRVTLSTTGQPPEQLNWSGAFGDPHYDAKTGRFELTGLTPGDYALTIGAESLVAFVSFVVNDSDIEGLAVTLEPPVTIHGRIEVEGSLPSNFGFDRLNVRLRRAEMGDFEASSTNVVADGTFSVDDLPIGHAYRVIVSGMPSGFYLKTARLGGAEARDRFALVNRPADMEVVISSHTALVRGVVTGDSLQSLAAVQVALIPELRDHTELFKSTLTEKDGRFTFSSVGPGDYKLFAWVGLERLALYDPEILAQFEERGQRIHISESSNESVELKPIQAEDVR